MIEIAPSFRPPLATLLVVALALLLLAAVLLRRATRIARRRVLLGALAVGALLTATSAGLWSRRHAGTGTETARGWPRIVHARWVAFEGGAGRAGLQWRGVVENGLVYTVAAAALLSPGAVLVKRRRRTVRAGEPSTPA